MASSAAQRKVALARVIADQLNLRVDPDAMFDVQVKRIHEYKRQLLNILETVARYNAIRANPTIDFAPRVKIFAGKAAASYTQAKLIIKLAIDVAKVVNSDPTVRGLLKVVFLPNYNVSLAEIIMPAADLSEQISTAGMEASGTGNMKMALNGALTIGTLDGANVEMRDLVGDDNIFIFGLTAAEVEAARAQGHRFDASTSPPRRCCARRSTKSPPACSRPTTPGAIAASSIRSPITTISWSAPTSTPIGATQMKIDEAWRDRKRWMRSSDPQHRQCRLVLLRPHDRRIRRGNLERAVRADKLRRDMETVMAGGLESAGRGPRRDRGRAQLRSFRRARAASDRRGMGHPRLRARRGLGARAHPRGRARSPSCRAARTTFSRR